MALNGNFKETPFADLLKFYATSKQTVAVSVRLKAPDRVDGLFHFADGDLVGAKLENVEGREAIRRVLRLREGMFTVEIGARPAAPAARESLRKAVAEEVARLEEEKRAGGAAPRPGSGEGGEAWFSAPAAGGAPAGGPPPIKRPAPAAGAPSASQVGAARPAPGAPRQTPQATAAQPQAAARPAAKPGPAPGGAGARPAAEAPRRPAQTVSAAKKAPGGKGKLIAALVAVLAVVGAGAWYAIGGRPFGAPASRGGAAVRGVTDDGLVLGMVASFTGSNKERGKAMRAGWETAIGEANDAGGVNGRKLKLVVFDDGYDPARTGPAMKEAVETQKAFAIVGNVGTATSAVAAPYAGQHDAVFYGALSGADLLRKNPPDRHVFNFRASLGAEAAAAVRYLVDVRRIDPKRIATLEQDDDFGASGRRGAIRQLTSYGVGEANVLKLTYPRNTADVREALVKLKERASDVDAVVMTATYKPAATFVRRAKDANLKIFYTTVSADSGGLAEELVVSGQGYTEDVLLTQVVPVPTAPATTLIRYRKALEKYAPGEKPGSTSLEAWIGAQVFLEGLRRAGKDLDTPKLITALESVQNLDLGIGAPITFGPTDHQGCHMVWGWLLQPDGSYKQVSLE